MEHTKPSTFVLDDYAKCVDLVAVLRAEHNALLAAAGKTRRERKPASKQGTHNGVQWCDRDERWKGTARFAGVTRHAGLHRTEDACLRAVETKRAEMKAEYDARVEALAAADPLTSDVPRAPDRATDADPNGVYWNVDGRSNHIPYRAMRRGKGYFHACIHPGCTSIAEGDGMGGKGTHCCPHGGGRRCAVPGMHMADDRAPTANYTLSANASMRTHDSKTVPHPEWEGMPACGACLRQFDPTHDAVRLHVRKEHMVLSGLAEVMIAKGYGHLVDMNTGGIHDCAAGPSQRRTDFRSPMSYRFVSLFENDENMHADRTTSCEHAKLAGTLMDHGALGFTKEEGEVMDLTPQELGAMTETEKARTELARKRACERVTRDFRASLRAKGEGNLSPKVVLIRFNCDAYVDLNGKKVGGLFTDGKRAHTARGEESVMTLTPKKEIFEPAIEAVANRLIELYELQKDDEWWNAQPEVRIEHMRYGDFEKSKALALEEIAKQKAEAKRKRGESSDA
jgi:hypothetical protein